MKKKNEQSDELEDNLSLEDLDKAEMEEAETEPEQLNELEQWKAIVEDRSEQMEKAIRVNTKYIKQLWDRLKNLEKEHTQLQDHFKLLLEARA